MKVGVPCLVGRELPGGAAALSRSMPANQKRPPGFRRRKASRKTPDLLGGRLMAPF